MIIDLERLNAEGSIKRDSRTEKRENELAATFRDFDKLQAFSGQNELD